MEYPSPPCPCGAPFGSTTVRGAKQFYCSRDCLLDYEELPRLFDAIPRQPLPRVHAQRIQRSAPN